MIPASISARDFGDPLPARRPNTSSGRVLAKTGSGLGSTPPGVFSTTRRVPASQPSDRRIALGKMT